MKQAKLIRLTNQPTTAATDLGRTAKVSPRGPGGYLKQRNIVVCAYTHITRIHAHAQVTVRTYGCTYAYLYCK